MPLFLIECGFAEQLEATIERAGVMHQINDEESVRWLTSFLSAEKKETFCLYEVSSTEAIRKAAERAGISADVIFEVDEQLPPGGATHTSQVDRSRQQ